MARARARARRRPSAAQTTEDQCHARPHLLAPCPRQPAQVNAIYYALRLLARTVRLRHQQTDLFAAYSHQVAAFDRLLALLVISHPHPADPTLLPSGACDYGRAPRRTWSLVAGSLHNSPTVVARSRVGQQRARTKAAGCARGARGRGPARMIPPAGLHAAACAWYVLLGLAVCLHI
jgi:hypothetical protein